MQGNKENSCMGKYKDTLDIKLLDACNGDCKFCIEKGGKLSDAAPVDEFINKVKSINPKSVLVLGGEPFIYPHLAEFIDGIKGREIFITTNGSKLKDSELLESIAPHLTAVNVSLMHYSMEKHFEMTKVRLVPEEIKNGISILQKHGVSVRINSILLKDLIETKTDVEDMIEFAKYLGADDIRFSEVQEQPDMFVDGKDMFDNLNSNPYTQGCEQKLSQDGINVIVKQTCGLVNNKKLDGLTLDTINNCGSGSGGGSGCRYQKEGVLYPDLVHSRVGWISNNNNFGCHGSGPISPCH